MFVLKRKEPVDKAVRRCARERLDRALGALASAPADRQRAGAAVRRVSSLLALVSSAMDRTAAQRERRVLRSAVRRLVPKPEPTALLAWWRDEHPQAFRGLTAEQMLRDDALPKPPPKRKRPRPDPVVHRVIADLSEVRMRAGYWHVGAAGWPAVAPGLRSAYTRARRLATDPEKPGELARALAVLADQTRWLERAWPELMTAQRQRLLSLAAIAQHCAESDVLLVALEDDTEVVKLRETIATQRELWVKAIRTEALALFPETPGRFIDRHAGYWAAWRGED